MIDFNKTTNKNVLENLTLLIAQEFKQNPIRYDDNFNGNTYFKLTPIEDEIIEEYDSDLFVRDGVNYYFELDDVVGMVKEGVNDCIGFRFFPAPNNNANYPREVLRFKLKRIEKLKVVYSSAGKKFRKRPKQRN